MPRPYEAVYIFDSTLEDAAINETIDRMHALLSVEPDAMTIDHWGRRQLAYPIGTRENGYYVVARFSAEPEVLPEFERALRLDAGVVRYLISIHDRDVGAPPMSEEEMEAARRRDDDDDDED
jgi:small subunit ribosomal protein S6